MGRKNYGLSARMQEKTRRVLQLIDALAPMRTPQTLADIRCLILDRTGIEWHERTVLRDLQLLEELGFAVRTRQGECSGWVLRLRESERLQCAACVLVDCGEPIKAHIVKHEDAAGRMVYHREAMTKAMADAMAATLRRAGMRASVEVVRIRYSAGDC